MVCSLFENVKGSFHRQQFAYQPPEFLVCRNSVSSLDVFSTACAPVCVNEAVATFTTPHGVVRARIMTPRCRLGSSVNKPVEH